MPRSITDTLKLAATNGLLGEASSNLYAIASDLEGGYYRVFFYYYNSPDQAGLDQMSLIGTNFAALTPLNWYWQIEECPALKHEFGKLPGLHSVFLRADESEVVETIEPDDLFSEVDLHQLSEMDYLDNILTNFSSHACDALLGNVTANMQYILVGSTEAHEIVFVFGFYADVRPIDSLCSRRILDHFDKVYNKQSVAVCTYDRIQYLPNDHFWAIFNALPPLYDGDEACIWTDYTVAAVRGPMEKNMANAATQEIIKREFFTKICNQITSDVYAVTVDFVGDFLRAFVFFYNTPNQADATYISDALSRFSMAPGPDVVAIASIPAMTKSEYGLLTDQLTVYLRSDESVVLDPVNAADVFSELSLQDLITVGDPDEDFSMIYSHLCDALLGNITGNMQAIFLAKTSKGTMALLFCFKQCVSSSDIAYCKRILDYIRRSLHTECYAVSCQEGIDSIPAEKVISIFKIYEPEVPEYLLNPDM